MTLTERKYTICETAGVLKVNLTLKKPSLRCFYVYIEAIDKTAEGKFTCTVY